MIVRCSPTHASRPRRSRLRLRRLRRRLRSGRAPRRGDHPVDRTGTGSSSSTSRSESPRRYLPPACSSATTGIGLGQGADIPGAVLITSALMLGVYTIVKPGRRIRLGGVAHARARRPLGRALGLFSSRGRPRAQPVGAATDLPLTQRRHANAHPGAVRGGDVWDVSSSARCTCGACSGYDALQTGLRSCQSR